MQTAYQSAPKVGRVGNLADGSAFDAVAKVASVAIPFGCLVVRDASDLKAKLPTSAAEVASALKAGGGVALASNAMVSSDSGVAQFPIGKEFAALRKGRVLVLVEEAVTQGDQAFVRFADGVADIAKVQKGAFRKSADAAGSTAQVATLTPTVANAKSYQMTVKGSDGKVLAIGTYLSDADATDLEIVAGLKASLGTIPGIDQTGTTTLILTASVAGVPFSVESEGPGVLTIVATTANATGAATAAAAPGCYYKSSVLAGELAILEVNMGGI